MYFNLHELSSDEEDYIPEYNEPQPRPRLIRERFDFFNILSERQFFARFRLTKLSVLEILGMIEDQICTRTNKNNAVSPKNRLLLTLRFYATGCFIMTAGDFSGVSEATAFRIIETVTEAISHLKDQFIKMPTTPEEMARTSTLFSRMARFPRVIGVVDGTHIRMQSPGGPRAEIYRNRKGYFSKNVQVVAGPNLEIFDIVSRWQGAAHDQTIFNVSDVQRRFENGEFGNHLLLGDSGYECRQYLMPPLRQVRNPAENLYNESLIRTRQSVERLFGVWKRRFPILSLGIRVSQRKIVKADFYIVACAILHNIACKNREEDPPVEVPGPAEDNIDEPQRVLLPVVRDIENNVRYQARRDLINGWFARMVE